MNNSDEISLSPDGVVILQQSCEAYSYALKEKFDCTAVINGLDLPSGSSFNNKGLKIKAEKKYSLQMSKGLGISVWKDDLTTHKVDAVVNAANEHLSHGGGLALALSQAGGPQINKESRDIIDKYKKVPTGEAVVTSAGNLPCKMIIHAVGPDVRKNASRKEIEEASVFLQNAIMSILDLVKKYGLQSVAIPALSSGIFNFPLSSCADIIVRTLKFYHDNYYVHGQTLEIRLVNNDDPSVQEMEKACWHILGQSDMSPSYITAVKGNAQSYSSSRTREQIGSVTLHVKKGEIQEENVAVIVNTISSDCILSKGEISNAILTKAGRKMQDEIFKSRRNWTSNIWGSSYDTAAKFGDVLETQGYGLSCSTVYHTVCASQQHGKSILRDVVLKCLKKAAKASYPSISFPAIGTGNLGFNKTEVAEIMTNAVMEFAKFNTKQMDVNFVVYPKDTGMLKAFETKIASRESVKSPQLPSTSGAASYEKKSQSFPYVKIFAQSKEALGEAKSWSRKMLYPSHTKLTIYNNHMVYFGQKHYSKLMDFQNMFGVTIKVFFEHGKGGISIIGSSNNVSAAALQVEAMLCKAQEEVVRSEQEYLLNLLFVSDEPTFYKRTVDKIKNEQKVNFAKEGLSVVKVESIQNDSLNQLFKFAQKRVPHGTKQLYQRVKAQFCDPICKVSFHREYAPPKEQEYGAGIYFTSDVKTAMKLWDDTGDEEFVYIIVAQVLTGNETPGKPGLIVPPPIAKTDPLNLYDSLTGEGGNIYVIFNGQRALPQFVVTCKQGSWL